MRNKFLLVALMFVLSASLISALNVSLADQGSGVKLKSNQELIDNGNIRIEIYDNLTAGNLLYSELFINAIQNGSWGVMLGENSSNPLDLEYGKKYYKDYSINDVDTDFIDYEKNIIGRQYFYSPLGEIADEDISSSTNITTTGWFKGLFNWIIDSISSSYLSFNGTSLSFNETKLNKTIDDRMIAGSNSSYNATYDSFAYNQTIPAQAYTDSVNTSLISWATNTFVKLLGGNQINGTQDFNGGWTNGGLTISGGNLFAQTVYVYNLSSLSVSELNINGSMIPASGFDNIFDIGSAVLKWRNLFLGGNVTVNGSLNLGDGVIKWNESNYIFYNGTGWSAFGSGGGSVVGGSVLKQYVGNSSTVSDGVFNVTGTDWTTTRAVAVPYQTSDGAWRMRFNVRGSLSPNTDSVDLNISGIIFEATTEQSLAVSNNGGAENLGGVVKPNTSKIQLRAGETRGAYSFSGDVELESKPDWADDPSEVVSYWSKSGNDTYYSDGDVNITNNLNLGNGTIWYNDSANKYYYYNTTDWNVIGSGSGTSGSVPANAVMSFNQASCPTGWVLADGDNGTPDLRGIFVRGAGVSGVLAMANGSNFSADGYGNDSFQEHHHLSLARTNWAEEGTTEAIPFPSGVGIWQDSDNDVVNNASQASSATGEPRTGSETAPASYAMIYCMKLTTEDDSSGIFQLIGDVVSFVNSSFSLFIDGDLNVTGNFNLGNGTIAWNETSKGYDYFDGTSWAAIGSGSGLGSVMRQYVGNSSTVSDGVFNVSGTTWTTTRAVAIPYQTVDGAWRMRFNIDGSRESSSANAVVFLSGIDLKDNIQAISGATGALEGVSAIARSDINAFQINNGLGDSTVFRFSGDVELDGKPDWADDPVEVVSYWSKSGNDTYYSEGNVNITNTLNLGNGSIRYNDSLGKYEYYNTTDWNEIGSGSSGGTSTMGLSNPDYDSGWINGNSGENILTHNLGIENYLVDIEQKGVSLSLKNSSDMVLLANMNGTEGYNTDATIDATGRQIFDFEGNAHINTSNYKLGDSALKLDGDEDYLNFTNNEDFNLSTNDFTIELWVYLNSIQSSGTSTKIRNIFVDSYGYGGAGAMFSYSTCVDSVDRLNFRDGTSTECDLSSDADVLSLNTWYHVVVTRESGIGKLYLDGNLIDSNTMTGNIDNNYDLFVGAAVNPSWRASNRDLDGSIDELVIYKGKALSSQDILDHYNTNRDVYEINQNSTSITIKKSDYVSQFRVKLWKEGSLEGNWSGNLTVDESLNLGNGTIWFNDSDNKYYYYNTTDWNVIGSGEDSGGSIPDGALVQFDSETCPNGWIPADGTSGTPNLINITIDGQSVLRKQYVEGVDDGFNVTGTDWTTSSAVAIPYQTSDGAWRMKFNIAGTLSSTTASFTGTISGIATPANGQSMSSVLRESGVADRTVTRDSLTQSSNTFVVASAGNFDIITIASDIELASKPTWADEDSTLMYCQKTESDSSESNSFWQRVGDIVSLANLSNILHVGDTIKFNANLSLFANTTSIFYNNGSSTFNLVQTETPGQVVSFNQETCPLGWVLADGSNSTPDLRGIFVRGSGVSGVIDYANGSDMSADFGEYVNDSIQGHEHDASGLTFSGNVLATHTHTSGSYAVNGNHQHFVLNGDISESGPFTNEHMARRSVSFGYTLTTTTTEPDRALTGLAGNNQDIDGTSQAKTAGTPSGSIGGTTAVPSDDGTNGEPRTGAETAPASYAMIYCVKTAEDTQQSNSIWQTIGNIISPVNSSKTVEIVDLNVTGNFVANKQYVEGVDAGFNVTGTDWTTNRAVAIPYQTSDGAWRMKFNIVGILSPITDSLSLTLSGITSINEPLAKQSVTLGTTTTAAVVHKNFIDTNSNVFNLQFDRDATRWLVSGDIELDSKPTWAD